MSPMVVVMRGPLLLAVLTLASSRLVETFSLSSSAIRTHAEQLRDRGFTVVAGGDPVVEPLLVARAAEEIAVTLSALQAEITTAGFDPLEQQYLFHELCYRQFCRWDIRRPSAGVEAWAELCEDAVASVVTPIIEALQGPLFCGLDTTMSGAVVSWPGAPAQRPHADADFEHYERAQDARHRILCAPLPDAPSSPIDAAPTGADPSPMFRYAVTASYRSSTSLATAVTGPSFGRRPIPRPTLPCGLGSRRQPMGGRTSSSGQHRRQGRKRLRAAQAA